MPHSLAPAMSGEPILMNHPRAIDIAREVGVAAWLARARVLKSTDRVCVRTGATTAGPVVVKSMSLHGMKDRLAVAAGRTRLMRQWRGAMLLASAGIPVAKLVVLVRGRDAHGTTVESLVIEFIQSEHPTLLHALASGKLSVPDEHALARAVGTDLRRMFDAGVTNRDHKPSNLIPARDGRDAWRVVAIDTAGVRRSKARHARWRTLASLILEPIGVGHPIRRSLMMRALRALHAEDRLAIRRDWRAVAEIVRTHGDARPENCPLTLD